MKSAPLTIALGALALLVLRLTTGCAATSTSDVDLESGSRDNPIVNGQETADYPATGMLLQQGQPFCTGMVVGLCTVVTAAHCVENQDPSQISFGFGPSAGQIEAELKVVAAVTHPEWDSQQLANDIAVSVKSMLSLPADREPSAEVQEIACDHVSYFTTEAGLRALATALP